MRRRRAAATLLVLATAGVAAPTARADVGRLSVAVAWPDGFESHGAAGDARTAFVAVPAAGPGRPAGVYAADRRSRRPLATLPAPRGGWRVPLALASERPGSLLVLDAGGTPADAGRARATVTRIAYHRTRRGAFRARVAAALPVPLDVPLGSGTPYAYAMSVLADGTVAVGDALVGAVWLSGPDLAHWRLAYLDPGLAAGPGQDIHGVGRAPGGGTRAYVMRTPASLFPGLTGIAAVPATREVCLSRAAPPGGVWCLPADVFADPLIPAVLKPLWRRTVLAGPLADTTTAITADRFHPSSPWLYAARAVADAQTGGRNIIRRVDLRTGTVQTVARSSSLLDFTHALAAVPPRRDAHGTWLLAAMGQEENNRAVNTAIPGDAYVAPELLTLVRVPRSDS